MNSLAREILKKNPTKNIQEFKILVWMVILGSKAPKNRIKIISLLRKKPFNTNQISTSLHLDYKVIERHLVTMVEKNLLKKMGQKYGAVYFLSSTLTENLELFDKLISEIGSKK